MNDFWKKSAKSRIFTELFINSIIDHLNAGSKVFRNGPFSPNVSKNGLFLQAEIQA